MLEVIPDGAVRRRCHMDVWPDDSDLPRRRRRDRGRGGPREAGCPRPPSGGCCSGFKTRGFIPWAPRPAAVAACVGAEGAAARAARAQP